MLSSRFLSVPALLLMSLGAFDSPTTRRSNGYIPIVVQPIEPVYAGKPATWEVVLKAAVNTDTPAEIKLEGVLPIDFSDIPFSVSVPPGHDRVTFVATVCSPRRHPTVVVVASTEDGGAESAAVPVLQRIERVRRPGLDLHPTSGGYIPIVRLEDPNQTIHSGDTVTWQVILPAPLAEGKSVELTVDSDPRIAFADIPYQVTVRYEDSPDHRTAIVKTQLARKWTGSVRLLVADGYSTPVWVIAR